MWVAEGSLGLRFPGSGGFAGLEMGISSPGTACVCVAVSVLGGPAFPSRLPVQYSGVSEWEGSGLDHIKSGDLMSL